MGVSKRGRFERQLEEDLEFLDQTNAIGVEAGMLATLNLAETERGIKELTPRLLRCDRMIFVRVMRAAPSPQVSHRNLLDNECRHI